MTMTLVKLRYNSKLVPDPGLVLQTPLCIALECILIILALELIYPIVAHTASILKATIY